MAAEPRFIDDIVYLVDTHTNKVYHGESHNYVRKLKDGLIDFDADDNDLSLKWVVA